MTMLKLFLLVYMVLFFGAAFFWRSYRVWRRTGVNPYKLGGSDSAHDFIGRLFRVTNLAVLATIVIYASSDTLYQSLVPIPWLTHWVLVLIGVVLLLIALLWVLIAQAQMGDSWRIGIDSEVKTALVQQGIFRLSRNPIFLGMQVMLLGLLLVLPNAVTLAIAVLGVALIQIQVRLEEDHLLRLHGEDYRAYQRRVRRWL
ncbi:MAG: isoprenylcysteine carboxylmethyltransferase family protein [Caldilinea sp. CFX5]|nr:isoprenylcysteine carboxylmethyltransferase family protein [Caldilinea sp. CFX5]